MAVDNGTIYTAIRVKLDQLDADVAQYNKRLSEMEAKSKKSFDVMKMAGQAFAFAFGFSINDIAGKLKDALIDMALSFDRANEIIGKSTGATGDALRELNDVFTDVLAAGVEQSSDEIASALGEINTRLDLTGGALKNATVQIASFADVTNTNAKEAVVGVSQVMSRWNIQTVNMGVTLDKLALAAQKSGISVTSLMSTLSSQAAQLKGANYTFDESVALLANFEKAGVKTDTVIMAMNKAISEMSKGGRDAKKEIQQVFDAIKNASDPIQATGLAIEVFGTRGGPELADALRSGKFDIDAWTESIANAKGVVAATDKATETGADTMAAYANKTKAAFGGFFKELGQNARNTFNGTLAAGSATVEFAEAIFTRVTKGYFKTQEKMQEGLLKLQKYVSQQTSDSVTTQIQILERTAASAAAGGDYATATAIGKQISNLKAQLELADQAAKKSKADADAFLNSYTVPSETGADDAKQTAQKIADDKAAIEQKYAEKLITDKVTLLGIERDKEVASAEKVGADTANIKEYYNELIKAQEEQDRKDKEEAELASLQKISEETLNYATMTSNALMSILSEVARQRMEEIDGRYQAELEAAGLAEKTELEKAQEQLKIAQEANDAEAISDAQLAIKKAEIDAKFQKEKAKAQYDADMAEWNNKWIMSIVDGAAAVVESLSTLNPFIIGATGVAAAIQTGIILANQPKAPSFATGGIVMPSGSGTMINVAENGSPEMMINGGASGEAFLNNIAERIASVVSSRQSGATRAMITINGRQIEAEIMNIVEGGSRDGAMKIYDSAIVRG